MKKLFAGILCVSMLLGIGSVMATASEIRQEGTSHWMLDAKKTEDILAENAGEGGFWNVPYLPITPEIDGVISPSEYKNFRDFEDYMTLMASVGTEERGTTREEFEDFCMFAEFYAENKGFVTPYWGWDGTYLYLAFEVQNMNGFYCDPAIPAYLFAHNCLQIGIGAADAYGNRYNELGFGINSKTGDPITHTWIGNYASEEGDFAGNYDEDEGIVVYECRIQLQKSLGLADRTVQNGDQIKFAWLLSMNGAGNKTDDGSVVTGEEWQAAFCHGIGGPYSYKAAQYFATVTFTGLPDGQDVPVVDVGGSEEEEVYGLRETIDFSKKEVVDTFSDEGGYLTFVTEGEESFARFELTEGSNMPYIYSSDYPKNVQAGLGSYVAVKYRMTGGENGDIGIVYRNVSYPQYDFDNCELDTLIADGEWHVALFSMAGLPSWIHFIMNIGIVPYATDEACPAGNLDLAFVKVFEQDPYDLYINLNEGGESESESATDSEVVTDETNTDDEANTNESDSSAVDTTTEANGSESTSEASDEGCASVVGMSTVALLTAVAATFAWKKKE